MRGMIPVGQKKFNRIVVPDRVAADPSIERPQNQDGWNGDENQPRAEFLPIDMSQPRALYTENQLRTQLNAPLPEGVSDREEQAAIVALANYWRGVKRLADSGRRKVDKVTEKKRAKR